MNNDVVLSLIAGSFLLGIIVPLVAWVYESIQERKDLAKNKPPKKSDPHELLEEYV